MQDLQPTPVPTAAQPRRMPLYLIGVLLFILGPAIYFIQFQMPYLTVPWYVPILATVGVLCLIVSVARRRGIVRIVGLVLLALLCGTEWYFLVVTAKNPEYQGPVHVGQPMPAFATTFADGKPFSNKDLESGTPTALVFYRGHW